MDTRRPGHHGYLAVAHTYPGWLPEMRGSSGVGRVPVGADAAEPFGDLGRRARDLLHGCERHRLAGRDGRTAVSPTTMWNAVSTAAGTNPRAKPA